MKSYVLGGRFERIEVDLVGLLFKFENENVYFFVVVYYFFKYMEIYLLFNMEVEIIVDVVFCGWIKCYGCLYEIYIDYGS